MASTAASCVSAMGGQFLGPRHLHEVALGEIGHWHVEVRLQDCREFLHHLAAKAEEGRHQGLEGSGRGGGRGGVGEAVAIAEGGHFGYVFRLVEGNLASIIAEGQGLSMGASITVIELVRDFEGRINGSFMS